MSKSKQELQADRDFVADALRSIHTANETRSLDADEQARFDEGIAFVRDAEAEIAAIEQREAALGALAANRPASVERGDGAFQVPAIIVRDNPYDLADVRFGDTDAVRSQALRAVEKAGSELRADQEVELERLVRSMPQVATTAVVTSNPDYRSGFFKYVTGQSHLINDTERSALDAYRSVTLGTGTADLAVPTILDTTVIDTGTHSTNPVRQVASVKKIGPGASSWNGVSSAGVTASWDAEEAEVSDDAPTLAALSIPVFKGAAFVPFSIESEDWSDLERECARMIAIAKDDLEGTAFVSGNGSSAPQGIATALDGTSSEIAPTTAETFAKADIEKLEATLQPRYRRNASFMAHKVWINAIRAFETTINVGSLIGRTGNVNGGPGLLELIGYPLYENPDMDAVLPNAAASADNFGLFFGDWANAYYIVDRVGLTVEYIPHLFSTTTNRPSGSRGFYAYFRTGAEVVNASACSMLSIPTTA